MSSEKSIFEERLVPNSPSSAISARGLRKQYGELLAVDDVSFEIAAGHILALLGANGAGKSTTVHMLLGLIPRTTGAVRIAGYDLSRELAGVRSASAYVPDRLALYPHLTGLENLAYFHQVSGGPRHTRSQLEAVLERVGLERAAFDRRASTYSKGMCQKVGLAIALAKSARALFLDEPLSGLDPRAASEFCTKLRDIANGGTSVLMATHDLFRAHAIADTIGIMRAGRLVQTLRASEIDAVGLEKLYLEHMQ